MDRGSSLFSWILILFVVSWLGFFGVVRTQVGDLQPAVDADTNLDYPTSVVGWAERGRQVYVAEGCMYCHTQAVRPEYSGPEMARGWGGRSTVARDFLFESPPQIGVSRVGADLANIGTRKDEVNPDMYSDGWFYRHLYNPQSIEPESVMPQYKHLFKKRKISGAPSPDALRLGGGIEGQEGWEIVPKPDARALLAYMRSLDRSHPLAEAIFATPKEAEGEVVP